MAKREQKVRHILPLSGKDSLCTAIVQRDKEPDLPYEYVFWDVGVELPETYRWLNDVEKKLGISIHRGGKNLEETITRVGHLPSQARRFCTKIAKLEPYKEFIHKDRTVDKIINYVGFRYDEKDRIPRGGVDRITEVDGIDCQEVYPLIEAEVGIADVYRIISDAGLSVPNFFWQRLYDAVYEKCGPSSQAFLDELPPWTKAYLFNWRSRSNCYFCFYMRLYEWVGLLEHHPDMFAHAEELERVWGNCRSETRVEKHEDLHMKKNFDFHIGWPLPNIRREAPRLFERRVNDVYQLVVEGRTKPRYELDLLSSTSCGALCGK